MVAFARALLERRAHAGEPQRLEALDLEIARCGEDLARGLAGARARGFVLPLERVRAAFQLDPAEQRCLYLLLALAVSAEVREVAGSPDGTAAIELLEELVAAAPEVRIDDPDGRLLAYGLVEHAEHPGRLARLQLTDRIVELAYGLDRPSLGAFATLSEPTARDLSVPAGVRAIVRTALQRHAAVGRGPVPVLRGACVEGRALVSSIAHELGARLLVVRCGALPLELDPALAALRREAVLEGAVIVLVDAEQLVGDEAGRPDRTPAVEAAFASFAGPLALAVSRHASPPLFARTRGAVLVELPPLRPRARS